METNKNLIVPLIVGMFIVGYIIGILKKDKPTIKAEYYLEVFTDSIRVENSHTHRVYSGRYKDLDSLILKDNL